MYRFVMTDVNGQIVFVVEVPNKLISPIALDPRCDYHVSVPTNSPVAFHLRITNY
jgi:hypothetical protein